MSLLRRISLSLQRGSTDEPRSLPRSQQSFNDLSLGAASWDDEEHPAPVRSSAPPGAPLASVSLPAAEPRPTLFGSAPPAGFMKSPALSIPRTSVAHLLEQRLKSAECGTPRSSLDPGPASVPTPRANILGNVATASSPRSPRPSADMSEPASPRSPRTPGGRRRKEGKIDGMDYYEFCELIRSSSL